MTEARFPNLFIIGAIKCGTTAMSHYLAGHPYIFMSEQAGAKEPEYFAFDLWDKKTKVTNREEYLALFEAAPASARYLGEASVNYLYSQVAIPKILKAAPNARLIAMIRNPIDLAVSLHNERMRWYEETALVFEKAWRLQERRRRGKNMPAWCVDYRILHYGERAKIGAQLARVFRIAPREQVHIVVYDDFMADTAGAYHGVLDFLGLDHGGRTEFPVVNAGVRYRIPAVQRWLVRARHLRVRLGLPGGVGIHNMINRGNLTSGAPPPLRPQFRRELQEYFREDVGLLSDILKRDFRHWLE